MAATRIVTWKCMHVPLDVALHVSLQVPLNLNGFEEDIDEVLYYVCVKLKAKRGRSMIQKFWEKIIKELYLIGTFLVETLWITSESVTLADVNRTSCAITESVSLLPTSRKRL
ncbi:hypothetical protein OUZ56_027292 [Daphnia magna]|uniref:Uncharacterized protein n=1 Tax=Daphnia magna TaxID=35525 RepID=A0ABQ9ZQQ7_9CRUS|nr:hypothetical protein OUZ56_027292 [Daphnia magna]